MKAVKFAIIVTLLPAHMALADTGQPGFECKTVQGGPAGGATSTYVKSSGGTSIGEPSPNLATCQRMVSASRNGLVCSVAAAGSFAVFGISGTLVAAKLFKSLDDCLKSLLGIAQATGEGTGSRPSDPNPGPPSSLR